MAAEQQLNIKFVQEIEKYPCLYNYTLPEYSRKDTVEMAWSEIGKKVGITGIECKDKWRNVRSVFIRHLKPPKSASDKTPRKPYYLSTYLQFAIPYIKVLEKYSGNLISSRQEPSLDNEYVLSQSQFILAHDSHDETSDQEKEEKYTPPILQTQDTSSLTMTPDTLESISLSHAEERHINSQSPPEKKIKSQTIDLRSEEESTENVIVQAKKKSKIVKHCDIDDQRSNKMFLLSMLPDMNKMSSKQRRLFKRKMLELVDEVTESGSE